MIFHQPFLKNRPAKYWRALGIILIFLLFFSLRLYHLGFHDFWFDEIATVELAQHPWGEWSAPLYWILLHFWIGLFGISEFSLRFPSLIFGLLSIVLIFLLGKNLLNQKVGLLASIIMGLSPFHLWYAQEARNYSMVLFLGTLSSYLLFKAIEERKLKIWIFFILVSITGLYTNYFFILLFIAQLMYLGTFFNRLKLNLKNLIPFLVIGLGFLPYLRRFLVKFSYVRRGFWIPQPKFSSLLVTVENFILGYNANFLLYLLVDILVATALIIVIIKLKNSQIKPVIIFCLFLFLIPIIFAFLFSKLFFSVYLDRALIIASPYFYLVLSFGLLSLNKRYLKIGSLVILFSLICISVYAYYKDWMFTTPFHHTGAHLKKPIKPVVKFIEDNLEVEDEIVFTNDSVEPPFRFYSHREEPFNFLFVPGKVFGTFSRRPIYEGDIIYEGGIIYEGLISVYKLSNLEFDRLWVISCNWPRDGNLDGNSQAVKDFLDRNLKLEFIQEFDGLWIFRYIKK